MGDSTGSLRARPTRRRVLTGLGAASLAGCATRTGEAGSGTAVIGLRIDDSPALHAARNGHIWFAPMFSFGSNDPTATLSFGLVDPATGAIDLPMFAGLQGVRARAETSGYSSSFEAARLVPGRYATMQAHFNERPDSTRQIIRVLEFSGRGSFAADAHEVKGYAFTVAAGETVYVGTMVLSLVTRPNGKIAYAPPRIENEFAAAAKVNPVLAGLGAARGTRLMTLFGFSAPAPQVPRFVPGVG